MCTSMVDIQENIGGIPRAQDTDSIHRNVQVQLKDGSQANSRGGVDVNELMTFFEDTLAEYFSSSFLQVCPPAYKEFDMSVAKESCRNLR